MLPEELSLDQDMIIKFRHIAELKSRGTKVHLSYGRTGLGPKTGGGESWESIDATQAEFLAQRIVKNVLDWDLDGVDIFPYLSINNYMDPSLNVAFHYSVIKKLRKYLPSEKTISYTCWNFPPPQLQQEEALRGEAYIWHPMEGVISASHRYIDYINILIKPSQEDFVFSYLTEELGVPAGKVGWALDFSLEDMDKNMIALVDSIKERDLRGLSFFSANKEHNSYRGEFLKEIARYIYD